MSWNCDLCGKTERDAHRITLRPEYHADGVSEICRACHRDLDTAWLACQVPINKLRDQLFARAMRRAIGVLKQKFAARAAST